MWKLVLYTKLHLDLLENELSIMEEKGYILDSVILGFLFCFKKKKATKKYWYRVHIRYAKLFDSNLSELESTFAERYYANPIKEKWSLGLGYLGIWRYGKEIDRDFMDILNCARDSYIIQIVKGEILFSIYLLFSFCLIMIYEINNQDGFWMYLGIICSIASLVLLVYRVYELRVLKKRVLDINIELE